MNDYWNDPPQDDEPPECCGEYMTVDESGGCHCESCGRRIEPPKDAPEASDAELGDCVTMDAGAVAGSGVVSIPVNW
tara:strand:+ start:167 stop:397 length:231 start_codon:yes stop_codon:yes gene_type:complete